MLVNPCRVNVVSSSTTGQTDKHTGTRDDKNNYLQLIWWNLTTQDKTFVTFTVTRTVLTHYTLATLEVLAALVCAQ